MGKTDGKPDKKTGGGKGDGLSQRIWDLFASVKLSFTLLLMLAVVSVAGTLLPQNQHPEMYLQQFGQTWGGFVLGLGLNDAYHAPWFYLIMSALAVNLVVCSLNRLPNAVKLMRSDPAAQVLRPRPPKETLELGRPVEALLEPAKKALGRVGKVAESRGEDATVLFAQRGGWSRMGVYLVHLSVLIIFAGGMVGNIWGFSGFMTINEGQSKNHVVLERGAEQHLGFQVRLDKFTIERYPDGQVSEFRSDVTFMRDGAEIKKASLIVNDPAEVDGIDFYQSSYGTGLNSLTVSYAAADQEPVELALQPEVWNELPGGARVGIAEYRGRISMGGMYEGPIARLVYQPPQGKAMGVTAFKAGAKMPARGPVSFAILKADSVPYTGLSVKYDPGVWLIWVGCTLMVVGFLIAFYMSHQKVWISLKPRGQGGAEVLLAGSANKNRPAVGRLVGRLARELKQEE